MNTKNPASVSPWPTLVTLALLFGSSFVDRTRAPVWLVLATSIAASTAWAFFFIRTERERAAKADELELRIRAEGHSLALHFSVAAMIVFGSVQHTGLLPIELRHYAIILVAAYLIGPWIARRRYQ